MKSERKDELPKILVRLGHMPENIESVDIRQKVLKVWIYSMLSHQLRMFTLGQAKTRSKV